MAVRAVAAPRALARPRLMDARIVAAVFVGLIGLVGNLAVLGALAPAEYDVVVAVRDLPPGPPSGQTTSSAHESRSRTMCSPG
jgi:hypothetical protein